MQLLCQKSLHLIAPNFNRIGMSFRNYTSGGNHYRTSPYDYQCLQGLKLQETANVIQLNSRHFQYNYPYPHLLLELCELPHCDTTLKGRYLFTYLLLCKDAVGSESLDRTVG